MAQQHTDLLDRVLGDPSALPQNIRDVVHALRGEAQETRLANTLNSKRLAVMESLLKEHIETCDMSKADLKTIITLINDMKSTGRVLTLGRSATIWVCGLIVSISGAAGAVVAAVKGFL